MDADNPGHKKRKGRFYIIYRKLRFLFKKGTLLRKKHVRQRKRHKRLYLFRYLRFVFNRDARRHLYGIRDAEKKRIEAGPKGYESLTGVIIPVVIKPVHSRKSSHERIYRYYRIARYLSFKIILLRKARRKSRSKKVTVNRRPQHRRIFFLIRTGNIFRLNLFPFISSFRKQLNAQFSRNYLTILLNSTTLFLLAYFFVYLARLFTKALAAKTLDISSIVYYQDVDYLIRSSQWTMDSVKVVYTSAPFISLVICIISLILYSMFLEDKWMSRLLIFWVFVHSFVQVFGEVMIGSVVNQGFGYVLMYLYMNDTDKLFISLGSFVLILITGFLMGKAMLFTGNAYFNFLLKKERGHFILSQYLLPFLLGTGVVFAIKQPGILPFEMAIDLTIILFLIPAFLRMPFVNDLFFDEEPRKIRIWLLPLGILILIMIAFRMVLGNGIRL